VQVKAIAICEWRYSATRCGARVMLDSIKPPLTWPLPMRGEEVLFLPSLHREGVGAGWIEADGAVTH